MCETLKTCINCGNGIICRDLEDGSRVMGNTRTSKYLIINQCVSHCPLKEYAAEEIEKWYNLYGKTDNLHLGS